MYYSTLLEFIKRREKTKKEMLQLTIEVAEKRCVDEHNLSFCMTEKLNGYNHCLQGHKTIFSTLHIIVSTNFHHFHHL